MKRTYLRKVKSVSCSSQSADVLQEQQHELAPSGVKRRTRTSAAMIGLALSMGATGLLFPRQDDGVAAAEPQVSDGSVATMPASRFNAQAGQSYLATAATSAARVVEHRVQQGETLQQLATRYQVNVQDIITANRLTPDSVLKAGQLVRVPIQVGRVDFSQSSLASVMPESMPEPSPLVASASLGYGAGEDNAAVMDSPQDLLETERNTALDRLRQQRDRLRDSLAELRYEESGLTVNPSQPQQVARVVEGQDESVSAVEQVETEQVEIAQVETEVVATEPAEVVPAVPSPVPTAESAAPVPAPELSSAPAEPTQVEADAPGLVAHVAASDDLSQPKLPQLDAASSTYRVSPGDTIAAIARSHNIPQSLLIDANGLSDPNLIFVGQVLTVPTAQAPVVSGEVNASVQIASADPSTLPLPLLPSEQLPQPTTTIAPTIGAISPQPTTTTLPSTLLQPEPTTQINSASLPYSAISSPEASAQPRVAAIGTGSSAPAADLQGDAVEFDASSGYNPYVANLLNEVKALRQRNQPQVAPVEPVDAAYPTALSVAASPVAATATGSSAVNPHFADAVSPQAGSAVGEIEAELEEAQSELVAAAPLGSENYAPLLQPVTGRMVSPNLPPLPGADTFLPEGEEIFNGYMWPASGLLTSGYGWRWGRMHQGIDIAADIGTPIYAAADGVVEYAGWNSGGYGNMVEIRHADGSMTRYAHLNAIYVSVGQQLEQGEQMGEMGSTGYSTGPHLHFEVHLADQGTVNPLAYLPNQ